MAYETKRLNNRGSRKALRRNVAIHLQDGWEVVEQDNLYATLKRKETPKPKAAQKKKTTASKQTAE